MDINRALGQVIRRYRNVRGLTQKQLAEAADVDQGGLSMIERGKAEAPNDKLERLARALGVRVSALWMDVEGEHVAEEPAPYLSGVRTVPLISWVQAGQFSETFDPNARGSGDPIPTKARVGRLAYALRVRGDSMTNPRGWPTFPDGTVIIVDPERSLTNGALAIVRLENENEATFKRYVEEPGVKMLLPLNPQHPTIVLSKAAKCCGIVVSTAEKELDEP